MSDTRADLVVWVVLGAFTLLALVFIWNHLVHFLQAVILPFCRRVLGETIGGLLTELVVFLDGKAVPAREVLERAWSAFKFHVLGIKQTYRRVDANTVEEITVAHIRRNDDKVSIQKSTRALEWHEVPPEIREEMARAASEQVSVNAKEVVASRMAQRAREASIELTLDA